MFIKMVVVHVKDHHHFVFSATFQRLDYVDAHNFHYA